MTDLGDMTTRIPEREPAAGGGACSAFGVLRMKSVRLTVVAIAGGLLLLCSLLMLLTGPGLSPDTLSVEVLPESFGEGVDGTNIQAHLRLRFTNRASVTAQLLIAGIETNSGSKWLRDSGRGMPKRPYILSVDQKSAASMELETPATSGLWRLRFHVLEVPTPREKAALAWQRFRAASSLRRALFDLRHLELPLQLRFNLYTAALPPLAEPVAPHEPPPRASVSDTSDNQTPDSLPAPGSSGGR